MARIVINTTQLLSPRMGVGNYAYRMATKAPAIDTENDYRYYCRTISKKLPTFEGNPEVVMVKNGLKRIPLARWISKKILEIVSSKSKETFDLYFEPAFIPLSSIKSKKVVVTVFDFSFYLYPEFHPADRVENFRKNFWGNIGRADVIITASNYIKEEAVRYLNVENERVKVVPLGIDHRVFRPLAKNKLLALEAAKGLRDKFILAVGSVEPRKNLVNLINAYKSLSPDMRKEYKLVMVGDRGWQNEEIREAMDSLGNDLRWLGYVTDDELAGLYNSASLFVYPSYYEGFGLPPVEAMACGCPVVVSNASSLPEICGDAAVYVDPKSSFSISEGITKVLNDSDLRESLSAKGPVWAAQFDWETTAKEHVRIFNETLGVN